MWIITTSLFVMYSMFVYFYDTYYNYMGDKKIKYTLK